MISDSGIQSSAAPVIDQELNGTVGAVVAPGVPLCVDLDGTLVKSDTLVDSVLALARQKPAEILRIPSWIAQGKAQFKKLVTASVTLDVEHLPYNRPLLEWLRAEHGAGRAIYLATAADRSLAERVADHLGIFAGVLASDGTTNLAGKNKLQAFREHFGLNHLYLADLDAIAGAARPGRAAQRCSRAARCRRAGV